VIWREGLSVEERVVEVLGNETIWGVDLTAVPHLQTLVVHYLNLIEQDGVRAALSDIESEK
jgi:hypothetical protein